MRSCGYMSALVLNSGGYRRLTRERLGLIKLGQVKKRIADSSGHEQCTQLKVIRDEINVLMMFCIIIVGHSRADKPGYLMARFDFPTRLLVSSSNNTQLTRLRLIVCLLHLDF